MATRAYQLAKMVIRALRHESIQIPRAKRIQTKELPAIPPGIEQNRLGSVSASSTSRLEKPGRTV